MNNKKTETAKTSVLQKIENFSRNRFVIAILLLIISVVFFELLRSVR